MMKTGECAVWVLMTAAAGVLSVEAGYHTRVSDQPIRYDVKPGVTEADQKKADAALVAPLKGTYAEKYAHDILINRPDYIVFIPRQPMDDKKADWTKTGDTYNDHFHVIHNPSNGMLYAFWTQATFEEAIDQHIAFSRSHDKGRTWTPAEVLAGSARKSHPRLVASWQQPMLSKSGRLYCLWNQQVPGGNAYAGEMYGVYSDDDGATWSVPQRVPITFRPDTAAQHPHLPAKWCNWQRPLRLGEGGRFLACCSRRGKAPYDPAEMCCTEFWQYDNIDDNPQVKDIHVSYYAVNRDALRVDEALAKRFTYPKWEGHVMQEASIVKLPDGRLFAIMRSSVGHPFWTQSRDHGRTWTRPKILLCEDGTPYLQPRSPCPMYDWKGCEAGSGTYFALIHNTFDFKAKTAFQKRGPLYLIAGRFDPSGEQPVRFSRPRLFAPRYGGNSFYTSYTVIDGQGVLWFNDDKFFLLGRKISKEWFE